VVTDTYDASEESSVASTAFSAFSTFSVFFSTTGGATTGSGSETLTVEDFLGIIHILSCAF